MVTVKYDVILDELREQDTLDASGLFPLLDANLLFALNESITGLSSVYGPYATPASIIIANDGTLVRLN